MNDVPTGQCAVRIPGRHAYPIPFARFFANKSYTQQSDIGCTGTATAHRILNIAEIVKIDTRATFQRSQRQLALIILSPVPNMVWFGTYVIQKQKRSRSGHLSSIRDPVAESVRTASGLAAFYRVRRAACFHQPFTRV